ncbi:hypothetical protein GZ77_22675 [Endozoicomonas montiporae]|uniref:Uncharacterized protein n=2 Tax=Endozoicomonas montiporae TaxID=1027273 RepID=A0A081N0E4_9GAMM|nr:hypothetical protein [Endozoicomonas montiporae]AMO54373.1 hypothetical protein EZMO1_0101 [Endozoicomonas montiporae CL-33]KEQ11917.1 hypothetical protein GZ77_22675 [Endozoicomonas montiporae]
MKIDPSTTSTNLDYGQSSDDGSGEDQQNKKQGDKTYQPVLPHDRSERSNDKRLAARKARKKKRKIIERKTKKKKDQDK